MNQLPLSRPLTASLNAVVTASNEPPWLIFTSVPAVDRFADELDALTPSYSLKNWKGAYIGAKTAARARERGLPYTFSAKRFTAEGLLAALEEHCVPLAKLSFLFPRARVARPLLLHSLREAGAQVTLMPVYEAKALPLPDQLRQTLLAQPRAWVTLCSADTASRFHQQWSSEEWERLAPRLVSIGPSTSARIRSLGLSVECEAASHTIEGLIAALRSAALDESSRRSV